MSQPVTMADQLSPEGLRLNVLTVDDANELHAIFSDPETHTIGDGPISDISYTHDWLRRRIERRQQYGVAWYGIRLPGGTLIGSAGLFIGRTGDEPEIGFEVRAAYQGRGYGSLAAASVVAEAHRAGFTRVWATVRLWNVASLRSVARVGFTQQRFEDDERGGLVYLLHEVSGSGHPV